LQRLFESCNQYRSYSCTDNDASTNLEVVDTFCYLGDMLSVDGRADATVEVTIQTGWNKFSQLVPLLTNTDIHSLGQGGCIAVVCKLQLCPFSAQIWLYQRRV